MASGGPTFALGASLAAPIFGMVGVVVGAAVTGLFNWRLEQHREARERGAEELNTRATIRLLLADLNQAIATIGRLSDSAQCWYPLPDADRWLLTWEQSRPQIAEAFVRAETPATAFDALAWAFTSARLLQWRAARQAGKQIERYERTQMHDALRALEAARAALGEKGGFIHARSDGLVRDDKRVSS